MGNIFLVKLGGSLITDKSVPFKAKEKEIFRIAKDIKYILEKSNVKIILSHGSGSFGHTIAAKYQTHLGIVNQESVLGAALTADAAVQINRIVIKNFLKTGIPAVSFSPASYIFSNGHMREKTNIESLLFALDSGFLPVTYGDIIFDKRTVFSIYSGEKILSLIARKLEISINKITIIQCGDTNGVLDSSEKTIKVITSGSFKKYEPHIGGSVATDVTGGMLHKVSEALEMARLGINTFLINGNKKKELVNIILKNKNGGTLITKT